MKRVILAAVVVYVVCRIGIEIPKDEDYLFTPEPNPIPFEYVEVDTTLINHKPDSAIKKYKRNYVDHQ